MAVTVFKLLKLPVFKLPLPYEEVVLYKQIFLIIICAL